MANRKKASKKINRNRSVKNKFSTIINRDLYATMNDLDKTRNIPGLSKTKRSFLGSAIRFVRSALLTQ